MKAVENNFDNLKVNELLKKHFIELRSVSPAGSTHVLDVEGLKIKTIKFWSIWDNENQGGTLFVSDTDTPFPLISS